jgi:hypothetical protein
MRTSSQIVGTQQREGYASITRNLWGGLYAGPWHEELGTHRAVPCRIITAPGQSAVCGCSDGMVIQVSGRMFWFM